MNNLDDIPTSNVEESFQSSYRDLYKKRTVLSQEERRKRTLEAQKKKRNELFDLNRDFSCNDEDESLVEEMEVCIQETKKKRKGGLSKLLMFSEWFIDVPEDLHEKWYIVPSPVGKRCIVIANKGFTKMFTKWGKFMKKFQSALPCGFKGEYRFGPTILDCIWCERTATCYVLDVIIWKGQSLSNCEAEFRFYWLKTKFEETPELQILSLKNQYQLQALPSALYNVNDLASIVGVDSVWSSGNITLDGILFYHRNAHYHSGQVTPLVVWLKPFMVPEVLGVEVADSFMSECPDDYVSKEQYIKEDRAKRKQKKSKKYNMEIDISNQEGADTSFELESQNREAEELEPMAQSSELDNCENNL